MGEGFWTLLQGSRKRIERKGLPGAGNPRREPVLTGPLYRFMAPLLVQFPWLKRQLHPLLIHFPITFMLSATFFSLLYLPARVESFQTTAFHCLGGGLFFLPPAIWSGLISIIPAGQQHRLVRGADHLSRS